MKLFKKKETPEDEKVLYSGPADQVDEAKLPVTEESSETEIDLINKQIATTDADLKKIDVELADVDADIAETTKKLNALEGK